MFAPNDPTVNDEGIRHNSRIIAEALLAAELDGCPPVLTTTADRHIEVRRVIQDDKSIMAAMAILPQDNLVRRSYLRMVKAIKAVNEVADHLRCRHQSDLSELDVENWEISYFFSARDYYSDIEGGILVASYFDDDEEITSCDVDNEDGMPDSAPMIDSLDEFIEDDILVHPGWCRRRRGY